MEPLSSPGWPTGKQPNIFTWVGMQWLHNYIVSRLLKIQYLGSGLMLKCRFADDDDVDDSATMIAQLDKSSQIGPIGQNFFIFLYR